MADDRIVAIDVGSQQISAASFSKTPGGGLRLEKYQRADFVGDPGEDGPRNAQSKMAIKELAGVMKLGKGKVEYVMGSHPVLMKFVNLPPVGAEELDKIVGFEAQTAIPYPLNDVVWDYQLIGDPGSFEVEALLAAIKCEEIDFVDQQIQSGGMKSKGAEISPVAIYNALRFNYWDIEVPLLLIDIGARTTDLIFMEPGKVYIRTVKRGGADITRAVAKEFGIEFGEADAKKIADGFVALGGPYADHEDPEIAGMSKVIRNSLTSLHAEIMRTINFYRSQQGGNSPQLALLAGATSALPFIRDFFAEKLNIPIDHFNALRNLTVSPKELESGIATRAHLLGPLVGSALQQAGAVPVKIHLVPASVKADRDLDNRKPSLMLATGAVTALLLALGMYFSQGASLAKLKEGTINDKAATLSENNRMIDDLKAEIAQIDSRQQPYKDAIFHRIYWVLIFNYLNSRMDSDIMWITKITPLSNGESVIDSNVGMIATAPGAGGPKNIDALLINGLWRDTPAGNKPVYDYFNILKDDAVKATEANRTSLFNLADKDVSQLSEVEIGNQERFAHKWKFTLPLPPEYQVKYTK